MVTDTNTGTMVRICLITNTNIYHFQLKSKKITRFCRSGSVRIHWPFWMWRSWHGNRLIFPLSLMELLLLLLVWYYPFLNCHKSLFFQLIMRMELLLLSWLQYNQEWLSLCRSLETLVRFKGNWSIQVLIWFEYPIQYVVDCSWSTSSRTCWSFVCSGE